MIYTITLGFVPARIWERSLDAYQRFKSPGLDYVHIFVDACYPIDEIENRRQLHKLCADNGVKVISPGRNLGLHGNFNFALNHIGFGCDDIIIAYDADSSPISPGWDRALVDALRIDPRLAWSSLLNSRSKRELAQRGYDRRFANQIELWVTKTAVVNSICAWKGSFLKSTGGLHEPNAYYGGLEVDMFPRMKALGLEWGFLPQYEEDDSLRDMEDEEYRKYKWAHAHLNQWPGDFKSFLEAGCPINDPAAPHRLP